MNVVFILNWLHKRGWHNLLCSISTIVYLIKGYGIVRATFHKHFQAYEYRVRGISYLCPGPGWAYSYNYLSELLLSGFCFYFKPKEGDYVIDLGAGLGEETLIFAGLVGDFGKVISVEASPRVFKALNYVCKSNGYKCINTVNVALFDSDGFVEIEDNVENYLTNTINKSSSNSVHRVRAVALDTLISENRLEKVNFLKVNIEGAEQFLLNGSTNSLKLIENMCISCHDFRHLNNGESDFYMTKEKVKSFLTSNGFEVIERNTGNVVVDDFLYAKRLQ